MSDDLDDTLELWLAVAPHSGWGTLYGLAVWDGPTLYVQSGQHADLQALLSDPDAPHTLHALDVPTFRALVEPFRTVRVPLLTTHPAELLGGTHHGLRLVWDHVETTLRWYHELPPDWHDLRAPLAALEAFVAGR